MNRSLCCSRFCVPLLVLSSILCIGLAIIIPILGAQLTQSQVIARVTVLPGHSTFEQLSSPTLPLWKSIYFFNITNPKDFQNGKVPIVEVKGPYSYRENRTKFIKEVSSDQTTLTYTQQKTFHFDSANSGTGLSEEDVICTINLPLVGAIAEVESLTPIFVKDSAVLLFKELFSTINSNYTQLYVCHHATELAWNYTDPLVQLLYSEAVLKFLHRSLPHPYIQIQLNNSANDSLDSIIYTGAGDIKRIGQYIQWDGLTKLGIWPLEPANDINGTEGLFFHPYISADEVLQVFQDDAVRSFDVEYIQNVEHLGLQALRFGMPITTFESAFTRSENAMWGSWCPNGLIYLGATQTPTVPIFGSKPHFLDGDPSLRTNIVGLDPDPSVNRSQYDTYVDLEPTIGVNFQLQKVLQLNIQLNRTADFLQMKNLLQETTYFPILYLNEHAELTEDFKNYLEDQGLREIYAAYVAQWCFVAILSLAALIMVLISIVKCSNQCQKKYKEDLTPLIQ